MSNRLSPIELEERARRTIYSDGLTELFAAAVLFIMALFWVANPALIGVAAAFIVLYGWKLVEKAKERFTYPRIGFFQERTDDPQETARGILLFFGLAFAAMVAAIAVVGSITEAAEWRRAAPLLSGLLLAAAFWYLGDRSGLRRHRVVAVYAVATGVLLWIGGSGADYEAMVWHLLGMVLILGAIGTWALVHFARTHPAKDTIFNA